MSQPQATQLNRISQKRLQGELKMLQKDPMELIDTYPDEKDCLIWYFMVRGPTDTDYQNGFFIGKILHSPDYPNKGPDFMMLTPNGRFETNRKICLTNSSFHSESWSPIWNISTILVGFLSIMADDTTHGIAHIKRTPAERKLMAKESFAYNMQYHKDILANFTRFVVNDASGIRMKTPEEIKKDWDLHLSKRKTVTVKPKPSVSMTPPVDKPVVPLVDKSVILPVDKPVILPVDKPVIQQVDKPVIQPVNEPVVPPVDEPVVSPVALPTVPVIPVAVEQIVTAPVVVAEPVKKKPAKKLSAFMDVEKPKKAPTKRIVVKKTKVEETENPAINTKPVAKRGRPKKADK